MKRLKSNQRHNCDYCNRSGTKTPAVWRSYGYFHQSCELHKPDLQEDERRYDKQRGLTEADYQTWMRL